MFHCGGRDFSIAEPWPDTQTLVSIDTWTLPTPQTLVSIDTSQTLLRHVQTLLGHSKRRFRQVRRVGRVHQCQSCQTQTLWTLLTRPTRLERTFHHTRAQESPTVMLGMQPMGLLGGSNPWPWPFGTTTPSTSAVGRHPDTCVMDESG